MGSTTYQFNASVPTAHQCHLPLFVLCLGGSLLGRLVAPEHHLDQSAMALSLDHRDAGATRGWMARFSTRVITSSGTDKATLLLAFHTFHASFDWIIIIIAAYCVTNCTANVISAFQRPSTRSATSPRLGIPAG